MLMFLSNTFQEVFKFTEGRKLPTGFRKLKKGKEGEGGEIGEEVDGGGIKCEGKEKHSGGLC